MSGIGKVDSLWRYPVKSMRGEELEEAYIGFSGVYGDRLYAFKSAAAPEGFPYLTAREQEQMLLYSPRFRHPAKSTMPPNLSEAERLSPGLTPVCGDAADLALDVAISGDEVFGIDDPALPGKLGAGIDSKHALTLLRSDRSMTDCRPISLCSVQTVRQLAEETGIALDKRRFRANVYLDLRSALGFDEDALVGKSLRIGAKAVISVLERDPRCKMITLDPDTAKQNPEVLRNVVKKHNHMAGIYGAVLVEGRVRRDDEIALLT